MTDQELFTFNQLKEENKRLKKQIKNRELVKFALSIFDMQHEYDILEMIEISKTQIVIVNKNHSEYFYPIVFNLNQFKDKFENREFKDIALPE